MRNFREEYGEWVLILSLFKSNKFEVEKLNDRW